MLKYLVIRDKMNKDQIYHPLLRLQGIVVEIDGTVWVVRVHPPQEKALE